MISRRNDNGLLLEPFMSSCLSNSPRWSMVLITECVAINKLLSFKSLFLSASDLAVNPKIKKWYKMVNGYYNQIYILLNNFYFFLPNETRGGYCSTIKLLALDLCVIVFACRKISVLWALNTDRQSLQYASPLSATASGTRWSQPNSLSHKRKV